VQKGLYASQCMALKCCSVVAGQSDLYECALQGLDRIAKPIGGKFLLANLWPFIEQWAKDGDWRRRAGALCAIAQVAEGCRKALLPQAPLQALMKICCDAVMDSHPIVKWAACQAIGQICTGAHPLPTHFVWLTFQVISAPRMHACMHACS
jgi:importin-5